MAHTSICGKIAVTLSATRRELNLTSFKRENPPSTGLSYREAGVDIDAGDRLVENIKPYAKRTMRPEVLAGIGGFGALFEISKKYRQPVLVSGTDGVGTKLKLAFQAGKHDSVGIDLVAMSVNDILVQGAEPLFFLDYFACGRLDVDTATLVVKGIAAGCEQAGCALIGGETAEMPGMYSEGDYDLAGFCVGAVDRAKALTGTSVAPGDVILGLASSGVHSNGFSLVRRLIEVNGWKLDRPALFDQDRLLGDLLLEPTRIYVKSLLPLVREGKIGALAHITGGGLLENIPRVMPEGAHAVVDADSWPLPGLFAFLQAGGAIEPAELARTFNCGIGMVAIVREGDAAEVTERLTAAGETVHCIGRIEPGQAGCTVQGSADTWSAREDWSATHHA
jgi:phosphoribosylformylglycinamidine cyclo-ligase